MNFHPWNP
jgi:pilus assembly protein Flp/PilA